MKDCVGSHCYVNTLIYIAEYVIENIKITRKTILHIDFVLLVLHYFTFLYVLSFSVITIHGKHCKVMDWLKKNFIFSYGDSLHSL